MTTLISLSTIFLQVLILIGFILYFFKREKLKIVAQNSQVIIIVLFVGALLGSLYFSEIKNFTPCLLCWWQRIFIFGITILIFTADLRRSFLLRKQIIIFSAVGLFIALFHNIIDIFPTGLDTCGTDGPSCLVRYVYEFGYITIPMMSLTILVAGLLIALIAKSFPQESRN